MPRLITMCNNNNLGAFQVNTLLKQMTAETLENDVGVFDLPDLTQVKFTLLGKNKIDVAYQLEEKVRPKGLFSSLISFDQARS